MNFLAHCALAQEAARAWHCDAELLQGLLAGAVIGDFLKGPVSADWPVPLQAGVRLHRKIDALSNKSVHVTESNGLYSGELRRFAPIFTDILGDYFLSRQWADFHTQPLTTLSQTSYAAIFAYQQYLPQRGMRFVHYMQEEDLLANYAQWEHVQRGIQSVLRRLDRNDLYEAVEARSKAILKPAQVHFTAYYPELRDAFHQWRAY